jgi:gamma-glutamyl-gamma-aminobutyraldehyde dehydrogenase
LRRIGALVSKAHFDKVCGYLKLAKKDQVLMGGKESGGAFVEPTIIDLGGNDDVLARKEIFGPILSVITVSSFDEAISVANDTEYGLSASIFTANARRAIRGSRAIRAGTVTVNSFGEGDITTPFGGFKQSGFGGRDNSIHAHDQYTQLKTIWIDTSDPADSEVD